MSKTDPERLEDLEILAAHQAHVLEELNDVVIEQGRMIAELRRKLEAASHRIEDLADSLEGDVPVDKPPHW